MRMILGGAAMALALSVGVIAHAEEAAPPPVQVAHAINMVTPPEHDPADAQGNS